MILSGLKFFHSFISPFLRSGKELTNFTQEVPDQVKNNLSGLGNHNNPPSALCLMRARTIHHHRFSSSLGPLILLSEKEGAYVFALLYCAHTANILSNHTFFFSRLHHVDGFKARKYHTFSENEFYDLAVAHTSLPKEFCASHLLRSKIKAITSANIGDEVHIISGTSSSGNVHGKIKAVYDSSSGIIDNPIYRDLILLDIQGFPGDSGATVLSSDNEVIGLVVRTNKEGYIYCNKLYESKNLIHYLYAGTPNKPDLSDVYLITL